MLGSLRTVFSKDRVGPMLTLAMAAALLYLAMPRTVAAFITASSFHTIRDIQKGGAIDEEALKDLIGARRRALGWVESGHLWSELAIAEFMLADTGGKALDRERIVEAAFSLETALSLSPADPHAWTRRAYAEFLLNGPSEVSAAALAMSVLTARYEPDLQFVRLELSLLSWDYFREVDRELILDQIRLAWSVSSERVVNTSASVGRLDVARLALSVSPDLEVELDRLLSR